MLSVIRDGRAEAGRLWLNPAEVTIPAGWSTNIAIQLDGVTGVYGVQINLSFDPGVVAVIDADPQKPGVQIGPGACPEPDFVVINQVDNGLGQIDYAVTQLSPSLPCDGGEVAFIDFQCQVSDDSSPIHITQSLISDPDGFPIEHVTQDGLVTCKEAYKVYLPFLMNQ